MNKMFYSVDDLKNIVSKKEMESVQFYDIERDQFSITFKIGDNPWTTLDVDDFVKFAFGKDNIHGECEDGGVFVIND